MGDKVRYSLVCALTAQAFFMFLAPAAFAYKVGDAQVDLTAGLSQAYDDNITSAEANKRADFSTTASVGLKAVTEGKLKTFGLSGNLHYSQYYKYSKYSNSSQDINAYYNQELSKYSRFQLRDSFKHYFEPSSFEDSFGRTSGRYSTYINSLSYDYTRDISSRLSGSFSYSNVYTGYSRNDLRGSDLNSLAFGSEYALSPKFSLLGSYTHTRRDFEHGGFTYANNLSGGVRHYFSEQLYFDAGTGVDFIRGVDGQRFSEPVYSLLLTDEVDQVSTTRVGFRQEYRSLSYQQNIFNYWELFSDFSRQINARLGYTFSGFYGNGEYLNSLIRDKLKGVSLGLAYDFSDRLSGNLTYRYSRTDSNVLAREYEKNTVILGVKLEL